VNGPQRRGLLFPEPKVSVIVPLYNHAQYLPKTIDSILEQTEPVDEIIILNDASTDDSLEVARKIAKEKSWHSGVEIRVFSYHENRGIGAMRHEGSERARGDIICYLSSDDTWELTFVAEMKEAYPTPSPGISTGLTILYAGWIARDESGVIRESRIDGGDLNNMRDGYWATVVNFSTIWIPRQVFDIVNFDPTLRAAEDLLFERQCFELGIKFKAVPKILCTRLIHPGQPTDIGSWVGEAVARLNAWRNER